MIKVITRFYTVSQNLYGENTNEYWGHVKQKFKIQHKILRSRIRNSWSRIRISRYLINISSICNEISRNPNLRSRIYFLFWWPYYSIVGEWLEFASCAIVSTGNCVGGGGKTWIMENVNITTTADQRLHGVKVELLGVLFLLQHVFSLWKGKILQFELDSLNFTQSK